MEPPALLRLREQRLLAVIRARSWDAALAAANAVVRGGITMIEVTFTVPEAPRVMARLGGRAEVTWGAGTVLTPEQASIAVEAGAQFIVAPNVSLEVARVAKAAGIMYCPGAFTTGEILAAEAAGGHVVKVYPVGVVGGPNYIEVIRDPLRNIPMLAAGGTTFDNFVPFLRAGCVAIGLGASLADPKLAASGKFEEITRRSKAFVRRLQEADASASVSRSR